MIVGIGADIIEVARIARCIARHSRFSDRVFTPAEWKYCTSKGDGATRAAGRFAAKEAVAKALGTKLSWRDVEILADESGKPVVQLVNGACTAARGARVLVSISHCRSFAVAHAVAVLD